MKLQTHYTDIEQSKKLLELGVPADSADCYRTHTYERRIRQYTPETSSDFFINHPHQIPCWSVGRLMEIFEICTGETFERNDVYNIFSDIFTSIESALLNHEMDFSRLEE